MRKRQVLFATLAVVLVGAAGATSIFLLGSKQRRDDRAVYLAYERDVLVALRAARRVAEQDLRPALGGLRDGSMTGVEVAQESIGWTAALSRALNEVVTLAAPSFLGDIRQRWVSAIEGYARMADIVSRAADSSGATRASLLAAAEKAGSEATDAFERAAQRMQFHRRRLGLGPTSQLPDPAATLAS